MEKAAKHFGRQIVARADYASTAHWQALIAQIDKYGAKLFTDPITVTTVQEPRRVQPQHTNNLPERFFRDLRRVQRRKSGHNSMGQFLS